MVGISDQAKECVCTTTVILCVLLPKKQDDRKDKKSLQEWTIASYYTDYLLENCLVFKMQITPGNTKPINHFPSNLNFPESTLYNTDSSKELKIRPNH